MFCLEQIKFLNSLYHYFIVLQCCNGCARKSEHLRNWQDLLKSGNLKTVYNNGVNICKR